MVPYLATQSSFHPNMFGGGLQSYPHLSRGSSIWLCKANFVEACPGGHVIPHPLTSVWQDPKRPDRDMCLTQICYDAGKEKLC